MHVVFLSLEGAYHRLFTKRRLCEPRYWNSGGGVKHGLGGGGVRISCSRKALVKLARDPHNHFLSQQAGQDSVPVRDSKDYRFSGSYAAAWMAHKPEVFSSNRQIQGLSASLPCPHPTQAQRKLSGMIPASDRDSKLDRTPHGVPWYIHPC
jgi:hypothetical protein